MASGVLVVLLGEATKMASYLTAHDKRYRAVVAFGRSTDSFDAQGTTTKTLDLAPGWLDAGALELALQRERERSEQEPPVFSALKVGGARAHRLARKGEAPELPARPVRVRSLELLTTSEGLVEVEMLVSKGYYVRSFARDLGAALGVPAHLAALRRLSSGPFTLSEACLWPASEPPPLMSVEEAAKRAMPTRELTPVGLNKAIKGQLLSSDDLSACADQLGDEEPIAWLYLGQLVAIGVRRGDNYLVKRGFVSGRPARAIQP
jgi:tRNA pseudouridine55 synthase